MTTRILIVDDSALVRQMLTQMLGGDPDLEVVGTAPDPYVAREKIKRLDPDVLTLDVEMPRMDGLTFLENLMRLHPMPVVMISSATERGADVTLEALARGAVDFVAKPKADLTDTFDAYRDEIVAKVKTAAAVRVQPLERTASWPATPVPAADPPDTRDADLVIAIGASTGGTEAIREVLIRMPADAPPCVVTQHIPPVFSARFAERMDRECALAVTEARDGDVLRNGHVLVAPGDRHLRVERQGGDLVCRLDAGAPVNRHRPSVDVMFASVADVVGPRAVGVLLTGMGTDGADGMAALKSAGAPTLVQDEATSVVWGMPGSAFRRGASTRQVPIHRMARAVLDTARSMDTNANYQPVEV